MEVYFITTTHLF